MKTGFIIFAHTKLQNDNDIEDMMNNIKQFHRNPVFLINHPTSKLAFVNHEVGPLNKSNFIFGAFIDIVRKLSFGEIETYDNFCLVSANQYFMGNIEEVISLNTNYFQFYNTPDWQNSYQGMKTDTTIIGNPLIQPYGKWDIHNLHIKMNIKTPMASNWECGIMTRDAMAICKHNIDLCISTYPNQDMMSLYPGYCALATTQPWTFPPFFGTFDPSGKNKNLSIDTIIEKKKEGYISVKRVSYSKDCHLKNFIRENYYA